MRRHCIALGALLAGAAGVLRAQDSLPPRDSVAPQSGAVNWDARRELQTRAELEDLLARLEQAAESPGYSDDLRARARFEVALVRQRLADGDFQVGDRILLEVQGEEALSDTFTVQAGRTLSLPEVGHVPLAGVLRAELEPHLGAYLGRFLRDPVVHARALLRVAVVGSVGAPGFYLLSSDELLTDALMRAGGPTGDAKVTSIRIERGDRKIWEGDPLQQAIAEGRTLDQLNLQAGDRIVVPQSGGNAWDLVRNIGLLTGIGLSVVFILRAF